MITFRDRLKGLRPRQIQDFLTVCLLVSLGAGAAAVSFVVGKAEFYEPLRYPNLSQLYAVASISSRSGSGTGFSSIADYLFWKERLQGVAQLAAFRPWVFSITHGSQPLQLAGAQISSDAFTVMGVQPERGRTFASGEEGLGHNHVVMISHRLWRSQFGANPGIIGSSLGLNGDSYEVVGVLPAWYSFPESTDIWVPLSLTPQEREAHEARSFTVIARLRQSARIGEVRGRLAAANRLLASEVPATNAEWGTVLTPFVGYALRGVSSILLTVTLLLCLLVALVVMNASSVFMVSFIRRRKEFAIRIALGAQRKSLLHQACLEQLPSMLFSIVLAIAGGRYALSLISRFAAANLYRVHEAAFSSSTIWIIVAVCAVTMAGALIPAASATRPEALAGMHLQLTSSSPVQTRVSKTRMIVSAQVAIVVCLAVVAWNLLRAARSSADIDVGFSARAVSLGQLFLPSSQFPTTADLNGAYYTTLQALRNMPEAKVVGIGLSTPFSGFALTFPVWRAAEVQKTTPPDIVSYNAVSPGYFEVLGVPLSSGRLFNDADASSSPRVAIVNKRFVSMYYGGNAPIGRPIIILNEKPVARTIVGVVGDVRESAYNGELLPHVYEPLAQHPWPLLSFAVSSKQPRAELATEIRDALSRAEAGVSVSLISTMSQRLKDALSLQTALTLLIAPFSVLLGVLAIAGIHSFLAEVYASRERDIAIRYALGSSRGHVAYCLSRETILPLLVALGIGQFSGLMASVGLMSVCFGIQPYEAGPYIVSFCGFCLVLGASSAWYLARGSYGGLSVIALR